MKQGDRPVVITGNWKMYKTIEQAVEFIKELIPAVKDTTARIYLGVPFTAIKSAADAAKGSNIVIGAQNVHNAAEGAFTGEIATVMLVEAGAQFVILGHSERRRLFHETNEMINKKMERAIQDNLQPTLCVGESAEERNQQQTEQVLATQLKECLAGFKSAQLKNLILAYEPVWAIGTGQTATPEIAQNISLYCRSWLEENIGKRVAQSTLIQYGGSVNPGNAKELLDQPDVDGLLVGGACLSVEAFSKIVNVI